jgi:NADPH:quinone reductase-like Zn-dependent oxidoreductase
MKAAVLRAPGGLDRIEVHDIPDPGQPGPGQIRIALHATSLNYHDLLVANGGIPTANNRVLMSDGAGVVESVGEGVAEFRPGDHVVSCFFPQWQDGLPRGPVGDLAGTPGDGIDGFAAHFSVRAATAFTRAPRDWSHAEAATITTAGVTAWRALVGDGQIKTSDTVLVLGTGGVSIAALQIAKMMGAAVIATSSSDEKLERLRALGAGNVINYRQIPDWGKRVRDLTEGGVDHVVEVGGPGTLAQSIAAVRVGGHISLIGVLTGYRVKCRPSICWPSRRACKDLWSAAGATNKIMSLRSNSRGCALSRTAASPSISWPMPSVTRPAAFISARSPSNGEA